MNRNKTIVSNPAGGQPNDPTGAAPSGLPARGEVEETASTSERGLLRKQFRKIAPNGFGDAYNAYPHSMTWFNDYLYVGTTRANLFARGFHRAMQHPDYLGEIWPVRVPKDIYDLDLRAQIWRYYAPTDQWEKVYTSPMVPGRGGFDVPLSVGFRAMTPFQGLNDSKPALYVPTFATFQRPETVILRSGDGVNFEVVSEPGLGLSDTPRALRGFISFKGRLFISPAMGQKRWQHNLADVMIILVSSDPQKGEWQEACEPHFGNPNNVTVADFAEFNGYLYTGTMNVNEGFQVWKTDAEGSPPYRWKKVLSHGCYRGKLNQVAATLVPFKGHLYVGSAIQYGGFDIDNRIGPAAVELIRINPDDSWELIVGEPRITPEGYKAPLGGPGPGFGDPFAGYLWSMCMHDGWLYVGTACWATFLRYTSRGDRWPDWLCDIFNPKNLEKFISDFGGCDLWRSRDGTQWMPVTLNGFDNCFNFGVRRMVSSPVGLFAGMANGFGPEVAVKRVAGWTYEENPRGGLEIWLGSQHHGTDRQSKQLSATPVELSTTNSVARRSDRDDRYFNACVHQFFEGGHFRHFGFWRQDIDSIQVACDNLMAEILAFISEKSGNIIDIGCGLGATTQFLLKYFPPEAITGIAASKKDLRGCRESFGGLNFQYSSLPRLRLPSGSFDSAIWIKGFERLGQRRKLIRESFRLLKPGGQLVCFDVVFAPPDATRSYRKNKLRKGQVTSLEDYRNLLLEAGFQSPQIIDVTLQTWESFRTHVQKFVATKRLAKEIDEDTQRRVEAFLLMEAAPIDGCLLISVNKPS